ncbi:pentatricopeptide repeat-containing protein At5g66520-like [Cynara cardunculus var. scolymus]|uniref:pentatricopeptide repeat-containing protein At5g66520-like n=1 Tax=Cynara cardunculus var. scolymus TaxID=59895 RepID=UPI000D62CB2C|nr:pentatricopeptide repeat-containing protein At5g66520-like [Cynara cardunculus var. scolymus]
MESRRLLKSMARLLDDCKKMRELKQIHSQIITSPYFSKSDNLFLISRLIFFCAVSCSGSLTYASRVFRVTDNPNLPIYNAMIRAYSCQFSNKDHKPHSLVLYKQMLLNCIVPDSITIPFLLKECGSRFYFVVGQSIHAHSVKFGLHHDVYVGNSMIGFYFACGVLTYACNVFDEMSKRDIVSWNSIIIGCLRSAELDMALDLFTRMDKKNIITWNSVITGMVQGARPKEAIEYFKEMLVSREDMIYPDKITLASAISACASLGWLDHGKWVHGYMLRNGIECDMVTRTAMVDMYGKCGNVDMAKRVFKDFPKKDVLAWTSMISVYALHGYGNEAFDLFDEMVACGLRPNPVTFGALLTACAHLGLIERSRWYFNIMKSVYLIDPTVQHYACMVDILGRAGLFDEANRLIASMPIDPDVFVWGALLGACQMHGNVELGEKVAKHLISLQPLNHVFYFTLCDIHAKAGKFDDLENTRALMNDRGIKKDMPGSSMIEVDGIIYEFSIKGSSEVLVEETKSLLYQLTEVMKVDQDTLLILNKQ